MASYACACTEALPPLRIDAEACPTAHRPRRRAKACLAFCAVRRSELEVEGEGGGVEVGLSSRNSQTNFAGYYMFSLEREVEQDNALEFEHSFTFMDDNPDDAFQVSPHSACTLPRRCRPRMGGGGCLAMPLLPLYWYSCGMSWQ